MKFALPSAQEPITDLPPNQTWFSYFQDVWKALRGGLGISIGGVLNKNTTSASNSGTGATDLITYDLSKNTLSSNGDLLEIEAWGTYAANANNKTVSLVFGGQTILTTGAIAANGGSWSIKAKIIRTASSTQEIISEIISSNSSVSESATRTAGTQDLTSINTIKCVGTGGASSDITQYALIIKLTPTN